MNKQKLGQFISISCLLLMSYVGFAQNLTIQGSLKDSIANRALNSATVSLVYAKDSSLVSFSRTNEAGVFNFKNVAPGNYLISVSYVGYIPKWVPVLTGTEKTVEMGLIYMNDVNSMSTVTVTARRPPVVINGDSVEFNSENFKTAPNAVVEDLLKKMPGMEVDKAGGITVNGKKVTKVFVNGKEFFTGDPVMATKNLPADAVDKIQVYDRKSDQAMFTGIDDGSEETAINLKLKKDRNKSTFGKLNGGAGTPSVFDAQGNINVINNDEQFSAIGGANNTNRQNFSNRNIVNFSGGGGGRPGAGGGVTINFSGGSGETDANAQGIAETYSIGGNYSNLFNSKKTEFNANLSVSDVERNNNSSSFTQNLTPGNAFNRISNSNSIAGNRQQNFGSTIDHKVSDNFSFRFTPSLGLQQTTNYSEDSTQTYLTNGNLLNSNTTIASSASDAVNAASTLLLRKKFAKKGRTLSSTITQSFNRSNSTGNQFTEQLTYLNNKLANDSILDQQNTRKGENSSYSANLIYTEPLGKKSLLEFNTYLSKSIGSSSRRIFDRNEATDTYDLLNTRLTNEFNSEYTYSGGGMSYRSNQKKYNFSTGVSLQKAVLDGENISAKTRLSQSFQDILPNATFRYNFSQTKNFNLDYRTSTNQPSITQLQPVLDQSNINRQSIGNPDLKRSYVHNLNIRFFSSKILAGKSFFSTLNASTTNNSIVNYDSVLPNRTILTRPVNVNGAYRINGSMNYGFGIKKLKSRLSFGLNAGLNNNISYANGLLNTIVTKSTGPSMSYSYIVDDVIDINLTARYSFSQTSNEVNPTLNTNFLTKVFGADMTNYLPFNIVLNQSFNYAINTGRAEGFNTAIPIWNASFSKFFLKNKRAEIKMSAFDLLNKNIGISRNVSQNQIVDRSYNVISQYFMLTFTYSLQKSGLGGGARPGGMMIRM
ncbi:MAG: TonB-dependent receptor family protein [Chitinophagaceae bacterium]|nr:TonB-dependent receptor family protein [Chitinophagaceae bacterium]MCF8421664.1 TonB-dependent receptor family protein [Chitinophagaceae bacterium]